MARDSATTSLGAVNLEDLSNVVDRVSVEEAPCYDMCRKVGTKNPTYSWPTDSVRAAAANAHPIGDKFTRQSTTNASRIYSYAQILHGVISVSETQEKTRSAGGADKLAYKLVLEAIALLKDVELAMLMPDASVKAEGSGVSVAAKFGGLPSWLTTNVSRGNNGTNGGYSSSTQLATAPTAGTQRGFTNGILTALLHTHYGNTGGKGDLKPTDLMVSPYVASLINAFAGNLVPMRNNVGQRGKTIYRQAMMLYEDPYGRVMRVVPNPIMVDSTGANNTKMSRNAYVLNRRQMRWRVRRPMHQQVLGKVADAVEKALVIEGGMQVGNEKAHAVVADVYGQSAAS